MIETENRMRRVVQNAFGEHGTRIVVDFVTFG
jgi:hypothetical protein